MNPRETTRNRSGTVVDSLVVAGLGLVRLTVTGRTSQPSASGGVRPEMPGCPSVSFLGTPALGSVPPERGGAPVPWSERSHSRPALVFFVITALALFLAGCSDDDEPAAPTTTISVETSTSTSSTTTEPDSGSTTTTTADGSPPTTAPGTTPEQEVIDRYIGYWNARFEANSGTPNPDAPGLREFATGAQLDAVVEETQSNLDGGLAIREADDPHDFQKVTVVEIDGDRAVVQECVVSDEVIFNRESGEVVNDVVATHNVRGELLRVDGAWKVSSARLLQRFEGVAACALGS